MRRILNSNTGFSLIELVIVMVVFIIVLTITSSALNTVLTKGTIVQRSEESNIEGVIGLEMLRHDLAQAGLGLFTSTDSPLTYSEAADAVPALNNDSGKIPNTPRAVVTLDNYDASNDNIVLTGTDYLTIKATTLGNNDAAQRWTYTANNPNDLANAGIPKLWRTNDFKAGDRMIVLSQTYDSKMKSLVHKLVMNSNAGFEVQYPNNDTVPISGYTPTTNKFYYFYGISNGDAALRAPFNRVDYHVRRPATNFPTSCSPATGVLYKAVMSHANGSLLPEMPILDCVADMQIVLGWNTQTSPEGSNAIDVLSSADGGACIPAPGSTIVGACNTTTIQNYMRDPLEVRQRLRQIKVYLLVQDGARDPNFVNSNTSLQIADPAEGPLIQRAATANWVPGAANGTVNLVTTPNMLNYRWKVYRVVVKPKNLG